jgi:hypothetical protein
MLDEIKKRCIISNNYNTKAYCVKFNFYVLQTCSSGVEKKNIDSKRQYSFQILHSIGQTNLLRGALEAAPPQGRSAVHQVGDLQGPTGVHSQTT